MPRWRHTREFEFALTVLYGASCSVHHMRGCCMAGRAGESEDTDRLGQLVHRTTPDFSSLCASTDRRMQQEKMALEVAVLQKQLEAKVRA